jgi:hypothetical protein
MISCRNSKIWMMIGASEAQILGYMGMVHTERKALNNPHSTVYGVATDTDRFDELSTSNHHAIPRDQMRLVDSEEEFQGGIFPELQALWQSRQWRKEEKPTFAPESSLI